MEPAAFRTPTGRPVTAVTADEMRAVDDTAVDAFGISLLQMMEHAGRNLADDQQETVVIDCSLVDC
mgnify:CR=1 FL=1